LSKVSDFGQQFPLCLETVPKVFANHISCALKTFGTRIDAEYAEKIYKNPLLSVLVRVQFFIADIVYCELLNFGKMWKMLIRFVLK